MNPSPRKPVGVLLIVAGLIVYAGVVAMFASQLARLPIWLQSVIYLVLGIVWILPLKPVLRWMETGRFR